MPSLASETPRYVHQMSSFPPHKSCIERPGDAGGSSAHQNWVAELGWTWEDDGRGEGEEFEEILEGGFDCGKRAARGGIDLLGEN